MRRTLLAMCLLVLLAVLPASATVFRNGNIVSVEAGEVINDDLIAAGETVRIAGTVNGDVIAAGRSVSVLGPVTGSVMAAGQEVTVSGEVKGSVRAAGQTVTQDGPVGRNAELVGATVLLTNRARVTRDASVAGNALAVEGAVGRNLMATGNSASLRGSVGGRAWFEGQNLQLGPSAHITGDLTYRTPGALQKAPTAVVGGTVRHLTPRHPARRAAGFSLWGFLLVLLMSYVFGVVGLAVLPRVFLASGYAMYSRPWWNLLLGFLVLIVVPVAAVIIMLTIIGLPLGCLLLILWLFALFLAVIPVGLFLGDWLLKAGARRAPSPYLALLVGLIILLLLAQVPVLGVLVRLAILLFGLGVYARAVKGAAAELRARPAAAPAA